MNTASGILDGKRALEAGEWEDARTAFEAALRETGNPEALAGLSDALFFLGEVNESVHLRERAYVAFRRAGRILEAADAAVWLCLTYGMSLGNASAATGWLARAESLRIDLNEPVAEAWLDYCGAVLATDTDISRDLIERALKSAQTWGDIDLELCALGELGVVLTKIGQSAAGLRCVDEAMAGALGGERTTFYTVVMAGCSMLTVCDLLGDLNRATQWSRAADEFMRDHGCPYLYAECRVIYGRVLLLTGNWTEAEVQLTKAVASTKNTFPGMYNRTIASMAELRLRQGRFDEAQSLIESIAAPLETSLVSASLALRRGQPAAAAGMAERWLRSEDDPIVPPVHAGGQGRSIQKAHALSLLIEARLEIGKVEAASLAADHLEQIIPDGGPSVTAAHAALGRGRVAAAKENPSLAVRCFEQALAAFDQLGLPFEAARSQLGLALVLAEDHLELAISEAKNAISRFESIGATSEADITAYLLRSWGVSGRSMPRVEGLLTRREQQILSLLATGQSNQEIADRLYISRRTAAHHVSNLLAKLGVRNRTEAAAYVRRDQSFAKSDIAELPTQQKEQSTTSS